MLPRKTEKTTNGAMADARQSILYTPLSTQRDRRQDKQTKMVRYQ